MQREPDLTPFHVGNFLPRKCSCGPGFLPEGCSGVGRVGVSHQERLPYDGAGQSLTYMLRWRLLTYWSTMRYKFWKTIGSVSYPQGDALAHKSVGANLLTSHQSPRHIGCQ